MVSSTSVEDAAHNIGTASQILDVDVTLPVVSIDGGASATTVDTSPWIYGRTAEKAGTIVHVAIGGQSLTAIVLPVARWGVSATTLPDGTYHVVASITDDAAEHRHLGHLTSRSPSAQSNPTPIYRPDAAIRVPKGSFVGVGIYAASTQQVTKRLVGSTRVANFVVRITNRGDSTDSMAIRGAPGTAKFKVSYLAGVVNVTGSVTDGTYRTRPLLPGASAQLMVKVTKSRSAHPGDVRTLTIRSASSHVPSAHDTVTAIARVVR